MASLIGTWTEILTTLATALVGVACLASALHGYLIRRSLIWERLALFAAALILIKPGWDSDLGGLAILAATLASQRWIGERAL